MKKLILPLVASIGMMACGDDIPVHKNQEKNVEYQSYEDYFNVYKPSENLQWFHIKSENDFKQLTHFKNTRPGVEGIVIDFKTEDLIYVIDTEKPNTTYKLKAVSVVEFNNNIEIKVKSEQHNEGGGLNTNVRPYTRIIIPKTNKTIVCKYVK